uniref:Putative secreted protein n=1 Tax=Anopheles triannulatus TaxID=58253 RepID=A0A2M4B7I4_9DIPT
MGIRCAVERHPIVVLLFRLVVVLVVRHPATGRQRWFVLVRRIFGATPHTKSAPLVRHLIWCSVVVRSGAVRRLAIASE